MRFPRAKTVTLLSEDCIRPFVKEPFANNIPQCLLIEQSEIPVTHLPSLHCFIGSSIWDSRKHVLKMFKKMKLLTW